MSHSGFLDKMFRGCDHSLQYGKLKSITADQCKHSLSIELFTDFKSPHCIVLGTFKH